MKALDLTGQRFNRLVAVATVRTAENGKVWFCKCDCGNDVETTANRLTTGNTKSCGCLRSEYVSAKNRTHGFASGWKKYLYHAYRNAKRRCDNPDDKAYKRYGARGIKFLFVNLSQFVTELGPQPAEGMSVDRKDNNGHYEPGNVRWATTIEQRRNQRGHRPAAILN